MHYDYYAKRLGGDLVNGSQILCPGPGHNPNDRSLSVFFKVDGSFTVHSHSGDPWQLCRDHVRTLCGLPQFESRAEKQQFDARSQRARRTEESNQGSRTQLARALWDEAVDPRGTLVDAYLGHRGLVLPDEMAGRVIRYHPHCPFDGDRLPCMIAKYSPILFDPGGAPTAIHRTALKPDGSGHCGKKMLGSVHGQCVKLSADEDVGYGLHIAEGIETSLALYGLGMRPIWAATTAGCIRTFPLLCGVECLTICADNDRTGLEAAEACFKRWQEGRREVFMRWPELEGADYADCWMASA